MIQYLTGRGYKEWLHKNAFVSVAKISRCQEHKAIAETCTRISCQYNGCTIILHFAVREDTCLKRVLLFPSPRAALTLTSNVSCYDTVALFQQ